MNLKINGKDVPLPSPYSVIPQQPRTKPMKILNLGLSRTGTLSLWAALNQLNYTTYHGFEACFDNANGSLTFWNAAVAAKLAGNLSGIPKTASDFDEVLWRYDALTDTPCVLFSEELLTAYPDAKVILTERDVDSWVASMQRSYYKVLMSRGMQIMRFLDADFLGKYYAMGMGSLATWTGGDVHNIEKLKEGYVRHYARIRAVVPKERLLEWHPRDGWEPLCEFLGKDVPEGQFPKVNQGDWVAELHGKMLVYSFVVVVLKGLRAVSPVVVVGAAWWWFRR
ncbi:hypothetical protein Q7P35_007585 [Cladosporium inversicolor]